MQCTVILREVVTRKLKYIRTTLLVSGAYRAVLTLKSRLQTYNFLQCYHKYVTVACVFGQGVFLDPAYMRLMVEHSGGES